ELNVPTCTHVYTDGSSVNYEGGYGIVVVKSNKIQNQYKGKVPFDKSTNNISELYAILKALELIEEDMIIYSDSLYAINVIQGIWKMKVNTELVESIRNKMKNRRILFEHVK